MLEPFAIKMLYKHKNPINYLYLLEQNFQEEDIELLCKIADYYQDEYLIHEISCRYLKIFQYNSTPTCVRPLEILYQKLTCGIHRTDLVKTLFKNGVLPDYIKQELPHDSYQETRNFYKQIHSWT